VLALALRRVKVPTPIGTQGILRLQHFFSQLHDVSFQGSMLLHALTRHTWGPYHLFQQKSGINLLQLCRLQLREIHLRRRLQRRRVDCSLLLLLLLPS
jgi:hypothetical protein